MLSALRGGAMVRLLRLGGLRLLKFVISNRQRGEVPDVILDVATTHRKEILGNSTRRWHKVERAPLVGFVPRSPAFMLQRKPDTSSGLQNNRRYSVPISTYVACR